VSPQLFGFVVEIVLLLALTILPALIGIFVANRLNRKLGEGEEVTWPKNIGVAISIFFALATCSTLIAPKPMGQLTQTQDGMSDNG
jgi:hypothetical protein